MTGFGQGEASAGRLRAVVEVRSVNHRFADLKLKLPPELTALEQVLHRRLQGAIRRGRLDVSVTVSRGGDEAIPFEINRPLVASYVKAAEQIKSEYRLAGEVSIQAVLSLPDVMRMRAPSAGLSGDEEKALMGAFEKALAAHEAMRVSEGKILARDIMGRIAAIERLRARISKRAPRILPLYVKRLKARIKDLDGSRAGAGRVTGMDEARLAQEVAFLAERSDITEELVRLGGYVEQLESLMAGASEPAGKKLDFIMQEMSREANTISSKAIDLGICQGALEMKAEVEKIREQVQNIE